MIFLYVNRGLVPCLFCLLVSYVFQNAVWQYGFYINQTLSRRNMVLYYHIHSHHPLPLLNFSFCFHSGEWSLIMPFYASKPKRVNILTHCGPEYFLPKPYLFPDCFCPVNMKTHAHTKASLTFIFCWKLKWSTIWNGSTSFWCDSWCNILLDAVQHYVDSRHLFYIMIFILQTLQSLQASGLFLVATVFC